MIEIQAPKGKEGVGDEKLKNLTEIVKLAEIEFTPTHSTYLDITKQCLSKNLKKSRTKNLFSDSKSRVKNQ